MNRPGDAQPLGRGAIDRPVQADDPAEGADGIALVGSSKASARLVGDRRAAGVVVLEDRGGGLGEVTDQPQGAVEVEQVVVRQLLAVADVAAVARFGPRVPGST